MSMHPLQFRGPVLRAFAVGCAFALSSLPALAHDEGHAAPPDWCKSKFGADDEIGSANHLSPEKALEAAKLVKTGKTYRLSAETNSKTPAFGARSWALAINQPGQVGGASLGHTKTTFNDDIYMGYVGTGTQIDGLGHIGVDNMYYNCNKGADFIQANGLKKLGIEKVPAIATRGVVLDMTDYFGKNPVPEGTAFNRKEIDEQANKQGIEIRKGDVVLFYTGWLSLVGKENERYLKGEPGLGVEGAKYLVGKEVVAIGADSWALEVIPFENKDNVFEVHQVLLPRSGTYILENIDTAELVKDKGWEFMFVLGASRMTGGVQAIITPVAIR